MAKKGPAKSGRSTANGKRAAARATAAARSAAASGSAATARSAAASDGAGAKDATAPLITRGELKRALFELASTMAPADIGDLLGEEHTLRERADALSGIPGNVFHAQLDLAIACVRDHADGVCPQIPFWTIALLAAALAYLADDLDIIPDFLPERGVIDDALVLAMACSLGEAGIRRYCAFKSINPEKALGLIAMRAPRRRAQAADQDR